LVLLPGSSSKPPAAPEPQAAAGGAAQAWSEIKDLKDIAVFEAFRKQYGMHNVLYDTLAAQKISELKATRAASGGSSWWPWSSGKRQEATKAKPAAPGECEEERTSDGVAFDEIDADRDISVCQPIAVSTNSPRPMYLLGRALDRKGDYSGA